MSNNSSKRSGVKTVAIIAALLIAAYFLLGPALAVIGWLLQAALWTLVVAVLAQVALAVSGRKGIIGAVRTKGLSPAAIPEAFTKS